MKKARWPHGRRAFLFKRETGVEPATLSNAEQTDLDAERGDIIAGSADYSADGWCFMTYKPN